MTMMMMRDIRGRTFGFGFFRTFGVQMLRFDFLGHSFFLTFGFGTFGALLWTVGVFGHSFFFYIWGFCTFGVWTFRVFWTFGVFRTSEGPKQNVHQSMRRRIMMINITRNWVVTAAHCICNDK